MKLSTLCMVSLLAGTSLVVLSSSVSAIPGENCGDPYDEEVLWAPVVNPVVAAGVDASCYDGGWDSICTVYLRGECALNADDLPVVFGDPNWCEGYLVGVQCRVEDTDTLCALWVGNQCVLMDP